MTDIERMIARLSPRECDLWQGYGPSPDPVLEHLFQRRKRQLRNQLERRINAETEKGWPQEKLVCQSGCAAASPAAQPFTTGAK